MKKLKNIFVFIALILGLNAVSQDFPKQSNPPKLVNDFADILSQSEENALEQKLVQFDKETSNQIAVVSITTLNGMDVAQYATELAHNWGIGGSKKNDNGVLILIKPSGGKGEKKAFIAVGYGLEGVIPDATAYKIVNYEMIPYFKNGKFYQGIDHASDVLMALAKSEYSAAEYEEKAGGGFPIAAFLIIGGMFLMIFLPTFGSAYRYSRVNNIGTLAALWLILGSGRNSSSGYYNNFSSGTGFFGGSGFGSGGGFSGGGGFGGFGGGGFGGGGAGGSW